MQTDSIYYTIGVYKKKKKKKMKIFPYRNDKDNEFIPTWGRQEEAHRNLWKGTLHSLRYTYVADTLRWRWIPPHRQPEAGFLGDSGRG